MIQATDERGLPPLHIGITYLQEYLQDAAVNLGTQLDAPVLAAVDARLCEDFDYLLIFSDAGLSLQATGKKAPGPVRVDWVAGANDHRRKFGGGKGQLIAKAVGLKSSFYPSILDATAGLGGDAFVLASLGCRMTLMERSPVVYALLADGLARAQHTALGDADLAVILPRIDLHAGDSMAYMRSLAGSNENLPGVVYLDPMFPQRSKSASVKKEMATFHHVVGQDLDAAELLDAALAVAEYRVVVKRPTKAPHLSSATPGLILAGKTCRYDIYPKKKMP